MALTTILLIVALICFIVAALSVPVPRVNLVACGLALWLLAVMLGSGGISLR